MSAAASDGLAWAGAWEQALTELEFDVDGTERLIAQLHLSADHQEHGLWERAVTPWTPPGGLGVLPPSLADRAAALLDRQRSVAVALTGAMTATRRQQRAAAGMRQHSEPLPAYVDTAV